MAEAKGRQFKMLVIQPGPVPPSGGPLRDSYLDHHGRAALDVSAKEYEEAVALLGDCARRMPTLPEVLVEKDEGVRRAIQREKRGEWLRLSAEVDQATVDAIEPHIRKAVASAIEALNYLEDHELMEEAHSAIHRTAFLKRGLLGCPIVLRDEDEYWSECPINLSHLRIGVSAGMVSEFECSICGELAEDCDHQMGEFYPKIAARDGEANCNICGAGECVHPEGETFLVPAHARARNINAEEVSFVARPRYPLARIYGESMDLGVRHDDPRIRYAAAHGELHCDADLGPCKGFNEMKYWDLNDFSTAGISNDDEVEEVDQI